MQVGRFFLQATVAAFITMIFIFVIKKATVGKNIPFLSAVSEGV